jgi:glycosyltransferase involved in cell wall biosynthesis
MPRILHVSQATGGVETSLRLLLQHLDRAQFEVHLACPPGQLGVIAREMGVPVFEINMVRQAHVVRDTHALASLILLLRRGRYGIVHGHSAKGGYLARLAGRIAGHVKTVYHPRAFSYLSQRGLARTFFRRLERLAVPWTDLVIATCESERRRAIVDVGFAASRVVVIPNAVDVGEADVVALAAPTGSPVILTVGRLSYQKNPEMFVRMAKLVAEQRPDSRFVMCGAGFAGPLERTVYAAVAAAGLGDRFEILPWCSKGETLNAMSRCTVFVLTSRFEGMPNALLEALMLGKPAVVTDVEGSRDVLAEVQGGRLVPLDDDRAMAAAVLCLLADPEAARELGNRGAAMVREQFTIERTAAGIAAAYRTVLGSAA